MRINNNGHLLLNTTSHSFGSTQPIQEIFTPGTANGGLSIRSNDSSSSTYHGLGVWVRGSSGMTTGTGYAVVFFHGQSGSSRGSITVTSSSTAYNTTSDYRLKENVTRLGCNHTTESNLIQYVLTLLQMQIPQ
jgi:hypothetical protein